VRIIDGEIFVGKTEAEQAAEEQLRRVAEIDGLLAENEQKSTRPLRDITAAREAGEAPDTTDTDRIAQLRTEAAALRLERQSLITGVAG
jgi:hypothetical protein